MEAPSDKQETDQSSCGNKKKNIGVDDNDTVMGERIKTTEELPPDNTDERRKVSYKETLSPKVVPSITAKPIEEEWDVSDYNEYDDREDDPDCPTVKISVEENRRLRKEWKKALIVKLMSHSVSYNFLVRRLRELWQVQSEMKVIDVGNEVYIVRLANDAEIERALYGGPWIIADHYLAVRKWYHDLDPHKFSVNHIAVWVRFPDIPIEYYEESFLMKIGRLIGTLLRVDKTIYRRLGVILQGFVWRST